MRSSARLFLPWLALVALLAALPSSAQAYQFDGERWPGKTITVYNAAPLYEGPLRRAIRAWNSTRSGVRFERASRDRARIWVEYGLDRGKGPSGCEGGKNGHAFPGYPGAKSLGGLISVRRSCRSSHLRTLTIMHELGHVLSLGHETRRCSIMNSELLPLGGRPGALRVPARCRGSAAKRLLSRLLAPDDILGVRALSSRPPPPLNWDVSLFHPGEEDESSFPTSEPVPFRVASPNPTLDYRWHFGDPASGAENVATGMGPHHLFRSPGYYTVTLWVLDGGGVVSATRHSLSLY
jgi:hypothetical protein